MKTKAVLIIAIFINSLSFSQSIQTNDSIKIFVDYLTKENHLSSKEYLLQSFEKNDIIVLSERHHQEIKQYELIIDVIKDERFKGNVYTEVGVYNSKEKINDFLKKEGLSKEEKETELLTIYRNLDYEPVWDKYNYYYLLSSIYDINQQRKENDKIFLFPLDVEFCWDSIKCPAQYLMFQDMMETNVIDRNRIMGKHFIKAYGNSKSNNPNKKKALVILNTYHGYTRIPTFLPLPSMPTVYSTGEYIFKTYPTITKGILINGYSFSNISKFVAGGKWDAAFKITGNKNIGFDLKNTPFGTTTFDMYNFGGKQFSTVNFEYIFDGFIFYSPIEDFELAVGIPNIFNNKEFIEEFYRRTAFEENITIDEAKKSKEINDYIETVNNLKIGKVQEIDELNKAISNWLTK